MLTISFCIFNRYYTIAILTLINNLYFTLLANLNQKQTNPNNIFSFIY